MSKTLKSNMFEKKRIQNECWAVTTVNRYFFYLHQAEGSCGILRHLHLFTYLKMSND